MSDTPRPPTLGLVEAAQLVKLHPSTLRERAASGAIPAAKLGRSWVFIEADLLAHVRAQYAPCPSTSKRTVRSGGSTSAMLGGGYAGQLERLIEQRRRSATTKSR